MTIVSFLRLAEIQTKAASQIPLLLGTFYALYRFKSFNPLNFSLMFLSLLTFDMMTTVLNNYMDYKKAIKKYGYGYESHNAIVKYNIKEGTVLATIVVLFTVAAAAGIMLFLNTGWVVLMLGAISFGIGFLYSFGPVPISRTPFGELFSGVTMGLVITFLAIYIHVIELDILNIGVVGSTLQISMDYLELIYILLVAIPPIVGIANIMLANNLCDMEDDIVNRRYTLPIYIGKEAGLRLFALLYYIGFASVAVAILLGAAPLVSILVFATFVPVSKHIRIFAGLQTKKDTFVLAVKNFVIVNAAFAVTIGIGALIQVLYRI